MPWCSSGTNGIGGQGITFAIVDSSSGAACGRGDEPGDRLGRGRQDEHPADGRGDLVEAELEAGHDPEVAAAATDGPEQVRVVVGVDPQALAVGGHDVGGEEVVDGQAVLAHEVADTPARGEPAEPDRAGVTEPGREAVFARPPSSTPPAVRPASAHAVRPSTSMSRLLHVPQVEDDPAVDDAVSGAAVPAAADRERQAGLAGEVDDVGDVVIVGWPGDGQRSAVDAAGHDRAGLVVRLVVGGDDAADQASAELRDGEGGEGRHLVSPFGTGTWCDEARCGRHPSTLGGVTRLDPGGPRISSVARAGCARCCRRSVRC